VREPWLLLVVLGVLAFILVVALFQWLWNATMPELFSWKPVRFWQSSGLSIAQMLFGPAFLKIGM